MSEQVVERWNFAVVRTKYPSLPVVTVLVMAMVTLSVGRSWALPAYLYLAVVGVKLAYIDADTKRLPNAIVGPAYLIFGGLLLLAGAFSGTHGAFLGALIGGAMLFLLYLLLALANPRGMGMGDVKLAGLLGMALGWFGLNPWLIGTFAGFFIGAVVSIIALSMGKVTRSTTVPFGPAMLAGAGVGILVGSLI